MTAAVGGSTIRPRASEFLRRYLIVVILFGLVALLSAAHRTGRSSRPRT